MSGIDIEYAKTKADLIGSIGDFDSPAWSTVVPATPDWTVRDVVAHVTANAVDGAQGTVPADLNLMEQFRDAEVVKARDEFADGQVHRREGRKPADLVNEWDSAEPGLLERFRWEPGSEGALPLGFDVVLLTDLCVHSDDIANALGRSPNRDSRAARIAFAGYCFGVDYRIRALGLPAIAVRYGEKEKTLGDGPPAATVSADGWDLLRAFAGRRSREQIAALDWEGDPEPYLPLIPAYGERADALVES